VLGESGITGERSRSENMGRAERVDDSERAPHWHRVGGDEISDAAGYRWETDGSIRRGRLSFPPPFFDPLGTFFLSSSLLCPIISPPRKLTDFNLFSRPPSPAWSRVTNGAGLVLR
jgi:hypothetical protein